MEVSIVGLGPTKDRATGETWGLAWDADWASHDRLFEMHHIDLIRSIPCRPADYESRLREYVSVPLYMQEKYYQSATVYPFDKTTGQYWNSSIAYALDLSIAEGYQKINIFGVDMKAEDEYFYQRPNLEYLIGMARGMGREVYIPDESPLCKFSPNGIKFGKQFVTYKDRYGWL